MKNVRNLMIGIILITLSSCRLGDFTIISTKNVDRECEMILLKENVEAKGWDVESGIDACIEQVDGGVVLKNAVIKEGFLRYKVKGDVWGYKKE